MNATSTFTEPRAMSSVLRLIKLMLLAKLAVDVTEAAITEWTVNNTRFWIILILSVPTLILVGVIVILRNRNVVDPHLIKRFLIITMMVIALQIALRPVVMTLVSPVGQNTEAEGLRGGVFGRSRTHVLTGILFMMIPAVIGAWVSERRGALRWAMLGIVSSSIAVVVVNWNDLTLLDLLPFVAEGMALVLLTLFVASLADQERDEQFRLQVANRLLAEQSKVSEQLAASRERMRVARELHDTVAHSLAGLVFQLDALGTVAGNLPDNARQILIRTKTIAKQGLEDTRAAITDLRAGLVEDSGLDGALQQHVETTNLMSRIPITFEHMNEGNPGENLEHLSPVQADALFRIAQEAIYNAQHHAQAHQIKVRLVQEQVPELAQTNLTLSVIDDGIGFVETVDQEGHYGLRGMRERAELAGAHLRVDSSIGKGTTLLVTVPLRNST